MNNEESIESQETVKQVWNSPKLEVHGTVASLTQHGKCKHGRPYPCPICAPKHCATS